MERLILRISIWGTAIKWDNKMLNTTLMFSIRLTDIEPLISQLCQKKDTPVNEQYNSRTGFLECLYICILRVKITKSDLKPY